MDSIFVVVGEIFLKWSQVAPSFQCPTDFGGGLRGVRMSSIDWQFDFVEYLPPPLLRFSSS